MAHLSPIRISLNSFPILFLSMILLDEIPNLLQVQRRGNILFLEKQKKEILCRRFPITRDTVCYPNNQTIKIFRYISLSESFHDK